MGSYQKRGKRSFLLVVEAGYDAKGKRKKKTKTIRITDDSLLKTTKRLEDYLTLELAKFQMEVDAGEYVNPEKLKFADFVDDWIEKHANKHLEGKTIRNYTEKLNNYILPRFGHRKLSDIKPKHIVDFLYDVSLPGAAASGRKEALGDSTIYEIDKTFRVVLNKAVEWQLIKESPMKGLNRPKVKKKRMKYYEDEEVVQFMKVMYEKVDIVWRMYFITAAISGMRRGEVIALQWPDIHFDEGYIELSRSIPFFEDGKPHVKSTKTDEDKRIIPMPGWYMEEMKAFKEWWDKEKELIGDEWIDEYDQYIFHSGRGKPYIPEAATAMWGKIRERHKLKNIRLHDLRHTMISFLLNEGESLLNVQERAGHSSSKITTDTYGHVTKKASKATAERFNKFDPRQFVNNSSTSGKNKIRTNDEKA
ncbi:site-specific integrase, partial [Virgibacillus sp. YIM 98842]|uniref:tyrosine-type recombinase/integrase n=1 Tax=Virgibacillus sp. YIM 98842 TaxID=2663533 RepID=UPI0013DD1FE3